MAKEEQQVVDSTAFHKFAAAEFAVLVDRLVQKHNECLRQLMGGAYSISDSSTMSHGLTMAAEPSADDVHGHKLRNSKPADRTSFGSVGTARSSTNSLLNEIVTLDNIPGEDRWLRINVISATSLRDADHFFGLGVSDPYCICQIRDKPDTKFSTDVIYNNLNPVWNHQQPIFDFDSEDVLQFIVMDRDSYKSDDLLGSVELPLKSFLPGKFEGTLPLDCGQGLIRVEIEVETDDPRQAMALVEKSRKAWPLLTTSKAGSSFDVLQEQVISMSYFSTNPLDVGYLTFRPNARGRLLWATIGTLLVLYDFATIPVLAVFDLEVTPWLMQMTVLIATFWTLDMLLTFLTGFEHNGIVEMRFSVIARRYTKTWFLVDLSLLTLDFFYLITSFLANSVDSSAARVFRLVKICRSVRTVRMLGLFHICKLSGVLMEYGHILRSPHVAAFLQVLEALGVLAALSHTLACIWYGLGVWIEPDTPTWVREHHLEAKPFLYRYSTSFHWVVTQFTPASTSVQPMNSYERIFTVCLDLMGIVIFSTFVSTITQKISQLRDSRKQHRQELEAMRQFFKEHRISFELSMRLLSLVLGMQNTYCGVKFSTVKAFDVLPEGIKRELVTEMHVPKLSLHGFFQRLQKLHAYTCQTIAADHANIRSFSGGYEIFQPGQEAKIMYFTLQGQYFYNKRGTNVKIPVPGWVGEPGLWVDGWLHRGCFLCGKSGDVMELDISGCIENMIKANHPALVVYMSHYASHFIRRIGFAGPCYKLSMRLSGSATPSMDNQESILLIYSDIWGSKQEINNISRIAFVQAGRCRPRSDSTTSQDIPALGSRVSL